MRITAVIILIALMSTLNHAQDDSIEKDFERERAKLSLVRYDIGEDATSGFYYFVYKSRSRVKKIRMIWNGGATSAPSAQDFYFKDGSPVLYVELLGNRKRVAAITRGRNTSLQPVEKVYLKNSKIVMWIENGKNIPYSDPRWNDKEKQVFEQFKGQLETYQEYREGKL